MRRRPRGARRWRAVIVLAAIGLLILADQQGWLLVRRVDDFAHYHGTEASVSRVIDGDTIEVELADALNDRPVTRIRLWGIDCPERATSGEPAEPLSDDAAALARQAVQDNIVRLWLEPSRPRGSFGRVLAHVELMDGRSLNELLLEAGLAWTDERWPHGRLIRYKQVETRARKRAVGVWAD